jgi:hypothetical protein
MEEYKMASNETLTNLATLLGALQEYNRPERETQMYAKKAMIDMVTQANLSKYKYDLAKAESEDARKLQLFIGQAGVKSTLETAEETKGFRKTSKKLEKSTDLLEGAVEDKSILPIGLKKTLEVKGYRATKEQASMARGENVLDNLYNLNAELPSIVQATASPAAKTVEELLAPYQDTFDMIEESRSLLERSYDNLSDNDKARYNELFEGNTYIANVYRQLGG